MLRGYPDGVPVHHVFAQRVEEMPDAVALEGIEGKLTYRQLDERADQIAGLLKKHGVRPGDFVATALPRRFDMPATFLGILKCGAAYCPLDLNHPAERIELILKDAKVSAVITNSDRAAQLPQVDIPVLVLDAPGTFDSVEASSLDLVNLSDVICVLYTSGSTGLPKGVLIPHRGVIRLLFESDHIPLGPGTRMLHHSPLVFDLSTYEIWGPLLHGGQCILYPGKGLVFHELRSAIRQFKVNTLSLGPAPFNLIIDDDPDVLTGIDYLILGGEPMSPTHARKGLARFPHLHLVNGYGPTEASTFATTYTVPQDCSQSAKSVPIGKPLVRTTVYIYDANNQLITDATPGELLIGGEGVALGYLNRPELTAEKFIADPFSKDPKARLYRTGDLCRWLPDGNLDYIGRIDHQVKIRGHRIEPGEIETAILRHPNIAQCIVVAGGEAADRFLIGYFTVKRGQTCSTDELRQHLKSQLPAYLVPEWLMLLPKLPINANGKVDRKALPDPRISAPVKSPTVPRTKLESELSDLWKQILRVENLGIDDCFFALGGTSIGMMKLCALIERRMQRFVSVGNFIAASTVAKMARFLDAPDTAHHLKLAIHLRQAVDGEPLFCLPGLGGHPMRFYEMAQNLRHCGSVYGLQFPSKSGDGQPISSIEEMAEICLEEIDQLAQGRPAHVMGYSFGGAVAFETARQMKARGMKLGGLFLLDSFLPAAIRPRHRLAKMMIHAKRLLRHGFGGREHRLLEKDAAFVADPAATAPQPLRPDGEEIDRILRHAFDQYQPAQLDGDVILIQAMEQPEWLEFCVVDPSGGWADAVAGRIHHVRTPGNHLSMFHNLHLDELIRVVDSWLGRLTAQQEPSRILV